jgi:hypothetical protein
MLGMVIFINVYNSGPFFLEVIIQIKLINLLITFFSFLLICFPSNVLRILDTLKLVNLLVARQLKFVFCVMGIDKTYNSNFFTFEFFSIV